MHTRKVLLAALAALALYAAGFWTNHLMQQIKVEMVCKTVILKGGVSL